MDAIEQGGTIDPVGLQVFYKLVYNIIVKYFEIISLKQNAKMA
jgi:hypothetical protein